MKNAPDSLICALAAFGISEIFISGGGSSKPSPPTASAAVAVAGIEEGLPMLMSRGMAAAPAACVHVEEVEEVETGAEWAGALAVVIGAASVTELVERPAKPEKAATAGGATADVCVCVFSRSIAHARACARTNTYRHDVHTTQPSPTTHHPALTPFRPIHQFFATNAPSMRSPSRKKSVARPAQGTATPCQGERREDGRTRVPSVPRDRSAGGVLDVPGPHSWCGGPSPSDGETNHHAGCGTRLTVGA